MEKNTILQEVINKRQGHYVHAIEVHDVFEVFLSFARDLVLLQSGGDAGLLLNPDYEAEIRELAAGTAVKRSLAVLSELQFVLAALPGNLNKSLLMTTFVSNVGELTHV